MSQKGGNRGLGLKVLYQLEHLPTTGGGGHGPLGPPDGSAPDQGLAGLTGQWPQSTFASRCEVHCVFSEKLVTDNLPTMLMLVLYRNLLMKLAVFEY